MNRLLTAILATLVSLCTIASAQAGDLTLDAAYSLAARELWSKDPYPTPEELAAARAVLEAQAKREPHSARWTYALARVASIEADRAQGDASKTKSKEALNGFETAVELAPDNAEYQYWLGSASFEHIDDVGMLSKMSLASGGRKAFERAIAIDPNMVAARMGLAQFYIGAPAIAGGSVEKAKAQGDALVALPDKRGEFQGRMVLAGVAVHEKDWAEMSRQFTLAETAGGVGADPVAALRSLAWNLLNQKKDPEAAAPVVARYLKVAPADDVTAWFLDAEVKRQLGHCADALPQYDRVLVTRPEAKAAIKRLAGS